MVGASPDLETRPIVAGTAAEVIPAEDPSQTSQPLERQPMLSKPTLRRFAVNVASLFSVQVANFLLPILTVPYVVRIIGPERLGLLNFSLAYIAYFTLLINYGFEMAAVRAIASNRFDKTVVDKIFSEVIAGKVILWVLSSVIFGFVTYLNPQFHEHAWLHVCTYITTIAMVLSPFWVYQAMEDLGRVAVFNLVVKVLVTASVFLFIREASDYVYQNLSLSVSQVAINAVALGIALKRFKITFAWPSVARLLNRFREDSTLFFSSVMITIYASSTVFFLGLLSTSYQVGIFSAGTRLEGIARSFVALALNQAFFPIVANAFGKGRENGLRLVQTAFLPLIGFMVMITIGLWIIAPYFVNIFYGAAFADAITVLRIVAFLPIVIGASNLLGMHTMLNLRMDKAFFGITAVGSVVGLVLNVWLIRGYGYTGAAYAWVLAELYIMLAMFGYLYYKGVRIVQRETIREAIAFGKARLGRK